VTRAPKVTVFVVVVLIAACGGGGAADNPSAPGECSAADGRYQRGKGGGAPPCCAGLKEGALQMVATQDGNKQVCTPPPGHAEFTCVKGTCGDGICEEGEKQTCGCAADCPGMQL